MNNVRRSVSGGALGLLLLLAACGTDATATAIPPTAPSATVALATAVPATDTAAAPTVAPTVAPTDTAAAPTVAPTVAPTDTAAAPTVAPTDTAAAPTATSAPVATDTAVPATAAPPTAKPVPPTAKPTVKPTAKPTTAPAAKVVTVREVDFAFEPASITIDRGTTIEWTNIGPTQHTVADDKVSWSSDILEAGQKYRHTFDTPGTITVICTLHPDMISTVIVK